MCAVVKLVETVPCSVTAVGVLNDQHHIREMLEMLKI